MTRNTLIEKTIKNLKKLPNQKLVEVSDFTDFLLRQIEDKTLTEGIQKIASESKTFNFLEEEEVLYSTNDLKERFK